MNIPFEISIKQQATRSGQEWRWRVILVGDVHILYEKNVFRAIFLNVQFHSLDALWAALSSDDSISKWTNERERSFRVGEITALFDGGHNKFSRAAQNAPSLKFSDPSGSMKNECRSVRCAASGSLARAQLGPMCNAMARFNALHRWIRSYAPPILLPDPRDPCSVWTVTLCCDSSDGISLLKPEPIGASIQSFCSSYPAYIFKNGLRFRTLFDRSLLVSLEFYSFLLCPHLKSFKYQNKRWTWKMTALHELIKLSKNIKVNWLDRGVNTRIGYTP